MEQLIRKWDGEEVIIRFDNLTGAWIIIAIHNTRLGIGTGGCPAGCDEAFRRHVL